MQGGFLMRPGEYGLTCLAAAFQRVSILRQYWEKEDDEKLVGWWSVGQQEAEGDKGKCS